MMEKNIYPIYKQEAMFLAQFGGKKHSVDVSLFGREITVKVGLEITSKDNKKSFEL